LFSGPLQVEFVLYSKFAPKHYHNRIFYYPKNSIEHIFHPFFGLLVSSPSIDKHLTGRGEEKRLKQIKWKRFYQFSAFSCGEIFLLSQNEITC
jgi:hypothetical protein